MGKRLKVKEDNEYFVYELLEQYCNEKKAEGRSKATIESVENSFKKFFCCFDRSKMTTKELDKGTVIHYKNYLVKGEDLKIASINHYLRDLRTFLNWCFNEGYIDEKIDVKLNKGQEEIIEVYEEEEIQRLIEKPKKGASFVEWRTWAIVCWILGTGNRIDTIINVKMGDVHFGRDEILIRAQKNKKASIIPLDKTLKNVLRTYISKCRPNASDDKWLFCNVEGNQLSTNALQQALYDYNKKRNVNRTSAHALRHTFAKMFCMRGGDVFRLQKIMGHSTLEMTRHYVNLFGIDLKQGYDEVSPLNNISKPLGGKRHKIKVLEDE